MELSPVTLTSKVDFWMQYRATRAVTNRLASTYLAWGFFVVLPLLFLIWMWGVGRDIRAPGVFGLPIWLMLPFGLAFMVLLAPALQLWNVISLRRRNPSVGGMQTYVISGDGYTVQGSMFDASLKWGAFLKAIETSEFILLFVSTRWAHIIPKHAAASLQDIQTIRAIIRDRLGDRARLHTG